MKAIKNLFTAGIVILLPVISTVMIVGFLINVLTQPFLEPTAAWLNQLKIFPDSFLLISSQTFLMLISKIIILTILGLLVIFVGWLGPHFLVDYLFKLGDQFLHRIPLINRIYKPSREIVQTLFSTSSKTFSQVVLAPYPNESCMSIGLITSESLTISRSQMESNELIPIFVPAAPNPTVGFMISCKKEQIIFLKMSVEEAIKLIVSCGVTEADFSMFPIARSDEK